jgi:hypothetical protein
MKRRSFLKTVAGLLGLGSYGNWLETVPPAAAPKVVPEWPEGDGLEYDFWSPKLYETDWSGRAVFRPTTDKWPEVFHEALAFIERTKEFRDGPT